MAATSAKCQFPGTNVSPIRNTRPLKDRIGKPSDLKKATLTNRNRELNPVVRYIDADAVDGSRNRGFKAVGQSTIDEMRSVV